MASVHLLWRGPMGGVLLADINSCKLGRGLLLHEGTVPASTGVMRGPGSLTQGSPGSPSMAAMADCGGDRRAL